MSFISTELDLDRDVPIGPIEVDPANDKPVNVDYLEELFWQESDMSHTLEVSYAQTRNGQFFTSDEGETDSDFDAYLDAHPDFNAAMNGHPEYVDYTGFDSFLEKNLIS
jgi:hypothetical protein